MRDSMHTYMHSALGVAIFVHHISTPVVIYSHDHGWHQRPTSVASDLGVVDCEIDGRDRQSKCAKRKKKELIVSQKVY